MDLQGLVAQELVAQHGDLPEARDQSQVHVAAAPVEARDQPAEPEDRQEVAQQPVAQARRLHRSHDGVLGVLLVVVAGQGLEHGGVQARELLAPARAPGRQQHARGEPQIEGPVRAQQQARDYEGHDGAC